MSRTLKLTSPAFLLLLVLGLATAQVRADSILMTTTGDTTSSPTFNRPGDATPPSPKDGIAFPYTPTSLSGLNIRYSVIPFNVSVAGSYSLTVVSELESFDNFLLLYSGGFDPASPLANVSLAIDNIDGEKTYAAFLAVLSPGVDYFAVVTGSQPTDFGAFSLSFYGPGRVNLDAQPTPTPEPATMLLLGTGLAGVGASIRRRKRRATTEALAAGEPNGPEDATP